MMRRWVILFLMLMLFVTGAGKTAKMFTGGDPILEAVSETRQQEQIPEQTLPDPTEPVEWPVENPYGRKDFVYKGQWLECTAGYALRGIDVSSHQGVIDWQTAADQGLDFVMVRVGYRGFEDGVVYEDELARQNILGALEQELKVGVYFFSQALNAEEAREEAEFVVNFIKDYKITMPVAFDWEHVERRADYIRTEDMFDREILTECASVFNSVVKAAGYKPMVYFNPYQAEDLLDLESLDPCGLWLAHYRASMTFPWKIDMWQYSDRGVVAGIKEKVDLNIYFPY